MTTAKRWSQLPDTPTIAESGFAGFDVTSSGMLIAPAGTPREIVDRLNAVIAKILAAPDIRELWNTQAMEIVPSTPEQFAARLRIDFERYGKLIKNSGIKIQQ